MRLERYDFSVPGEAEAFVELVKAYFPNSPWHPSVEKVRAGGIAYYRALVDGHQVGVSGVAEKTPHLAETVKTFVFRDYLGRGFGARLSQAIEDECRTLGFKKVMTTVFHDNVAMINIKLKQGYVIEGFHRDHETTGFHEYSLGKVLA